LAFHADQMTLRQPLAAGRRAALFRESIADKVERWTLGLAWAVMPAR
jgi:hypothetical protein